MQKWEYYWFLQDPHENHTYEDGEEVSLMERLDILGEQGWELVSASVRPSHKRVDTGFVGYALGIYFFFKRPISD